MAEELDELHRYGFQIRGIIGQEKDEGAATKRALEAEMLSKAKELSDLLEAQEAYERLDLTFRALNSLDVPLPLSAQVAPWLAELDRERTAKGRVGRDLLQKKDEALQRLQILGAAWKAVTGEDWYPKSDRMRRAFLTRE